LTLPQNKVKSYGYEIKDEHLFILELGYLIKIRGEAL